MQARTSMFGHFNFSPHKYQTKYWHCDAFLHICHKKKKDSKKKSDATDNLIGELNCFVEMYDSRGYCVIIIIRTVL